MPNLCTPATSIIFLSLDFQSYCKSWKVKARIQLPADFHSAFQCPHSLLWQPACTVAASSGSFLISVKVHRNRHCRTICMVEMKYQQRESVQGRYISAWIINSWSLSFFIIHCLVSTLHYSPSRAAMRYLQWWDGAAETSPMPQHYQTQTFKGNQKIKNHFPTALHRSQALKQAS